MAKPVFVQPVQNQITLREQLESGINAVIDALWQHGIDLSSGDDVPVFPDVSAGLAGTASGQVFRVDSSEEDGLFDYYRNQGSADYIGTLPSTQALVAQQQKVDEHNHDPAAHPELSEFISAEADRAQAAADTAFVNANLYGDTAEGLAETSDGEQFQVADGNEIVRYLNDDGTAVEVARYPSAQGVAEVRSNVQEVRQPLARYIGTAAVKPLIADFAGKLLLGVDENTGDLIGKGIGGWGEIANLEVAVYRGAGPVFPLMTDILGRVVLGYDRERDRIVGAITQPIEAETERVPLEIPMPVAELNHVLVYGASHSVGGNAGSVLSVIQPYENLTFQGGPRAWDGSDWSFGPLQPLVEDDTNPAPDGGNNRAETPAAGYANFCSSVLAVAGIAPADYRILASAPGRGGSSINQLRKGSTWYNVFIDHVTEAHDLNPDHVVSAVYWLEGSASIGDDISFDDYLDRMSGLQADIELDVQQITGQSGPVYLITFQHARTRFGNLPGDVSRAQLRAAQTNPKIFLSTPTYHLPYRLDNIHFTAVGSKWLGAYGGRTHAELRMGFQPRWLNPVSATIEGDRVRVRFDVPHMPMVLDPINLAPTEDFGFAVHEEGDPLEILDISVSGRDVLIWLTEIPAGALEVRYGMDYLGDGLIVSGGGSGNLRDSAPDAVLIDGIPRPLWNVCPHFVLPVTYLGV